MANKKWVLGIMLLLSVVAHAQNSGPVLGAYYFDGWTGTYPYHITESLKTSFANRMPKGGWITSTQTKVDEQIQDAHEAGLSFFSFCWYYNGVTDFRKEPLNHALELYGASPYKKDLQYCLLVANHQGFYIGPNDWPTVTKEWLRHFKSGTYLTVDGKPLIIFFSIATLVETFGSVEKVKNAFDDFRKAAIAEGLKGVCIAGSVTEQQDRIKVAEDCGVDIMTGYNYHYAGFDPKQKQIPISRLQEAEEKVWNIIVEGNKPEYIPVVTLNWDPRPWANKRNDFDRAPFYTGYSPASVYNSVKQCIGWMNENPAKVTKEKIAILYAWNEYGEGAWLTAGKDNQLLNSVKRALQ